MIKFYRRIRRSLLMENKTSKYFKYAIGEIVLVVIGILIALQINNWNDNRNRINKKNTYLKALKLELKANVKLIKNYINTTHNDIVEVANTLEKLNSKEAVYFNDSVLRFNMATRPIYKAIVKKSTFQEFINSGTLDEVNNLKLKNEILSIPVFIEDVDQTYELAVAVWNDFQVPYLMKYSNVSGHWDSIRGVKIVKPNYKKVREAFINNKDYANILALRLRMMGNYEDNLEKAKNNFIAISENINSYLKEND